jgi:hypothetical protein
MAGGGIIGLMLATVIAPGAVLIVEGAFSMALDAGQRALPERAPTFRAADAHTRGKIDLILARTSSRRNRSSLLDAIAAHHLEAGTVPEGEWPDGRVPYFQDDPVSSTRLAQLDEKWRGLDR